MKIEVYQEEIKRTMPDLGSIEANVEHMDLGVITEVAEILDAIKKNFAYGKKLDLVNVGEETADVAWYVGNKSTLSEITLNQSQLDVAYERFFEGHIAEVRGKFDADKAINRDTDVEREILEE